MTHSAAAASHAMLHAQVLLLLPWHVNETLNRTEEALVQEHLRHCPQCQAEASLLSALRTADDGTPPYTPDIECAFSNISRRLDAIQDQRKTRFSGTWRCLHGCLPRLQTQWQRRIAALQLPLIVILGSLLAFHLASAPPAPVYQVLSAGQTDTANLVVVFTPGTTIENMAHILHRNEASVISGPTVTDAYVLSLPQARLTQALHSMRMEPAIALVESLAAVAEHVKK